MTPFIDLLKKYKVILFDAYGVLKNYKGLIPGIDRTFDYIHQNQIEFLILTNDASRSPEKLSHSYTSKGLLSITPDKVISSGMLARDYLENKVSHGNVAYLGTPESAHYIETAGLRTVSIKDVNLEGDISNINALVLLDDEGFDWNHDLNKTINLLRKQNMPVIVANTDTVYPISKHDVSLAIGGLANMLEETVRKSFIRFGKPDAQMFNFAYEYILQKGPYNKNEILMVGDSLATDIIGGNKFGIDTALVLTGNTLPNKVDVLIETTGIIPDYICESVVIDL